MATNIKALQRIEKSEARRLVCVDNRPRSGRYEAHIVIHIQDRTGYTKTVNDRDYPHMVTVCNRVLDYGARVETFADLDNPNLKYIQPKYTLCKRCAAARSEFEAADKEWAECTAKWKAESKARDEQAEIERRAALEAQIASATKLYEALRAAGFEVVRGNQAGEYPKTMLNVKFDNRTYEIH
jgi:hypothetical protein